MGRVPAEIKIADQLSAKLIIWCQIWWNFT